MKRVIESSSGSGNGNDRNYADNSFSQDVVQWQKLHGRHSLPWQQSRDAYRVWLSEIMLQQTQVAAVIPYYQRFLTSFPDVVSLANASSEQVMAHWSGLGYYTRARNLHACAKRVTQEYAGVFPHQPELLAELPGIGRSTAAAIAAFSYGARAAILDGNVKRVFTRVFGIDGIPAVRAVEDDLWQRAQALMPEGKEQIQAYTQGLMDLGATLCTRSKPRCEACPLQARCVALATNRVAELPAKKPKKAIPTKQIMMLLLLNKQQVLLEKRPESGIWGGLYSLPELAYEAGMPMQQLSQYFEAAVRPFGDLDMLVPLAKITHVFSHFKLEISPYQCSLKRRISAIAEDTHVWYPIEQCDNAPLPAPIKKLLMQVSGEFNEIKD
ncbi:A/G-specific adenine glycosylase [Solimicrobium silvestre]|uniref:Adenine DNA glycosylase n=1 Tax=Solimicrobium silvestre TaxID=2099400 RepID=A0A2S9H1C7_9BURK|nr:A/G-specific adenine glycosylase [Solimicrobium silvestre]PRC93768.1 mutY: A/G-specific adenine glycosylase [Solimicrobium silvestre]